MTRVAALDLGTNTTRLLVADVDGERVEEVVRRTAITRLGEGVDARRRLLPVPIARVRNVLADYRREAERLGAERTLLVATSAVRDAENGEAFLGEIEWSYGFATRLLDGDEEAELTSAARDVRPDARAGHAACVDVGGGSTELSVDGEHRVSLDVGAVRLTERFLARRPAGGGRARGSARRTCAAAAARSSRGRGRRRRDGHDARGARARRLRRRTRARPRLTAESVERWLDRLASLPLAERRGSPGSSRSGRP